MTVFIHVSGGCVQAVKGTDNYYIIDWDDLEYGGCPICGKDLSEDNGKYCNNCYVDWSDCGYHETLAEIAVASNILRRQKQRIFERINK